MPVAQIMHGWGRCGASMHRVQTLQQPPESLPSAPHPLLAFGNGRSYGDSCLNPDGLLLDTRKLDHYLHWDAQRGIIRCQAGVLLADLIQIVLKDGWFPPVCPGTSLITLGGAIANDVHGKNHARHGSFGDHVLELNLLRSDGSRHRLGADLEPDLFRATLGGLGLTGLITEVTLQMRRVPSPWLEVRSDPFVDLDGYFERLAEDPEAWEYSVAWVDCAAGGSKLGRGLFHRARHADFAAPPQTAAAGRLGVPLTLPINPLRGPLLKLFNAAIYHRPRSRASTRRHYQPYFFPLDAISDWNRLYGPAGFVQYQCLIPPESSRDALAELMRRIAASNQGSPLAVLKTFGDRHGPGMLSFPRPGTTLAVDFPHRGAETLRLLDQRDSVVADAGGALYPAKDARMSPELFAKSFPRLEAFLRWRDPAFSSALWKRVMPQ